MPRLVYVVGWALLAVAGAFLLTCELTWRPGVTERNVRLIREGMTWEEVEAILGAPTTWQVWLGPARDLDSEWAALVECGSVGVWGAAPPTRVYFDADRRVISDPPAAAGLALQRLRVRPGR